MFSKILGLIFLAIIVFFFSFKDDLNYKSFANSEEINKCSKLNYEEIEYIQNQNFSDLSFEISFIDKKKWKKNRLKNHLKSLKNKELSSKNLRFFDKSERVKGLIKIKTDKIDCILKASIRPHGNLIDHRSGNMPSLNVNLKEGNIKGITRFLLLKPETRNGNNEIFNSVLFKHFGLLAPTTFKTTLSNNGQKYNVIFQEKIVKEMLERNSLRESFVLELDQRFLRLDPYESNHYSQVGITNSKLVLKNEKNKVIAEYATSLLNDLNRVHGTANDGKLDLSTLSKILEKEYFEKQDIFDSLMYAVYANHGLSFDDRVFYFNPFYRKFQPIYYDGMGSLIEIKKNKLSDRNLNTKQKFLPSAKAGAQQALKNISNLNIENLQSELSKMGLFIEREELNLIIEKLKSNLLYLSLLKEDQTFKITAKEDQQIMIDQNNPINRFLKRNFVYYSNDFNKFVACEINYTNCKNFNINSKDISELLRQNLSNNQTHLVYMGQNLLGSSSENFYYKNYDKIIKKKI